MEKKWKIAPAVSIDERKKFPEIEPIILQLLINRGLTAQEEIDEFLNPDFSQDLHDPFLFTKMKEVCERIMRALKNKEKVVVYCDYDADGVTSGSIVYSTIKEIAEKLDCPDENIGFYIPHRDAEGYGLNQKAIELLAKEGNNLLISTDCGISNFDEIAWLREREIDVIVVDHHQIPDKLPNALIIHTSAPGEIYPFKPLSAAGVSYKVASGIIQTARDEGIDLPEGHEKWLLDLVAIATVTDMMPLLGENRTLEKYGLVVLNKTRRIGLKKLIDRIGTPLGKINAHSIGFQIGPRLNAASRMDHANQAFYLLNSKDPREADELANQLDNLNRDRQASTEVIFNQTLDIIGEVKDQKILFAKNKDWSQGIVGLVAGRISDRYYRPVILVGQDSGKWIGSGRSIPEFDITAVLHNVEKYLARFGGHAGACGFDLKNEKDYEKVAKKITAVAEKELADVELTPSINIEGELGLDKASFKIAKNIFEFAPFGINNPQPIFIDRDLTVVSFEAMGGDLTHLKIMVKTREGNVKKLVGFRIADRIQELKIGTKMELVYELGINEWNGNQELQFKIIDFIIK